MQADHKDRVDSNTRFVTGNYGIDTTSNQEWCFVVMPDEEKLWPKEADGKIENDRRRKPIPLSKFKDELKKKISS
eukprot:scaffold27649_cov101-Isochrysis_galbana.AAC.1